MPNRQRVGTWIVLGMFAFALGAACFSLSFNIHQGARSLAFWGASEAELIDHAAVVRFAASDPQLEGANLRPVAQAPGMTNLRRALVLDPSFVWEDSPQQSPRWSAWLLFGEPGSQVVVAFDPAEGWVCRWDRPREVRRLDPALAREFAQFFAEVER